MTILSKVLGVLERLSNLITARHGLGDGILILQGDVGAGGPHHPPQLFHSQQSTPLKWRKGPEISCLAKLLRAPQAPPAALSACPHTYTGPCPPHTHTVPPELQTPLPPCLDMHVPGLAFFLECSTYIVSFVAPESPHPSA